MAMLCFFHYLILKILLVCLFVCLTVVGITESTKSITVVSTASVSTISAIVSAKTVSVGVGMPIVSRVEDSGISLSLSLGVSLTLLAGISHSGLLCGSRDGNKEGVVESISVAISVSVGSSNMDYCRFVGHSSDGTGNMFRCFMFNGITDSGCVVKTITVTESITIRVNKGGNCGCRVGGCKDGRVSPTLLATIVSVSITVSSAVVSSVVSTIVSSVS